MRKFLLIIGIITSLSYSQYLGVDEIFNAVFDPGTSGLSGAFDPSEAILNAVYDPVAGALRIKNVGGNTEYTADGDTLRFDVGTALYVIDIEINDTRIFGLDSTGKITNAIWNGVSIADLYIDNDITASNYLLLTADRDSHNVHLAYEVTGNTETLITVTAPGDGTLDFVVDNDLSNYSNTTSKFQADSDTSTWDATKTYVLTTIDSTYIDGKNFVPDLEFATYKTALDTGNLGYLNQPEVVAEDWDFTANPMADNEVANDITASNYTLLTAVGDSAQAIFNWNLGQAKEIIGNWINTTNRWAENEIVATVIVESEINTFAELQAFSVDKTLVNEEDGATIDVDWTFAQDIDINDSLSVDGNATFAGNVAVADTIFFDSDKNSGLHAHSDDVINMILGGNAKYAFEINRFLTYGVPSWSLLNEYPTATNPVIVPKNSDEDCGLTWVSADTIGITAGGALAQDWAETGGSILSTIYGNLRVNSTNYVVEGQTTGRNVLRTVQLLIITDGVTPGDSIAINKTNRLNTPIITSGSDISKGTSSGSFALSADGLKITMDITEAILLATNVYIYYDKLNNGGGEGYHIFTEEVGDNLDFYLRQYGSSTNLDWTTLTNTANDDVSFLLTFYTSS